MLLWHTDIEYYFTEKNFRHVHFWAKKQYLFSLILEKIGSVVTKWSQKNSLDRDVRKLLTANKALLFAASPEAAGQAGSP